MKSLRRRIQMKLVTVDPSSPNPIIQYVSAKSLPIFSTNSLRLRKAPSRVMALVSVPAVTGLLSSVSSGVRTVSLPDLPDMVPMGRHRPRIAVLGSTHPGQSLALMRLLAVFDDHDSSSIWVQKGFMTCLARESCPLLARA